jgi:hypothetical protein
MPGVTAREDRLTIALIALAVAVGAFALGFVAIIFGGDDDAEADPTSPAAFVATVPVTLTEFAIEPAHITVPSGPARLQLINAGTAVHNFSVPELGLTSPDIQPGEEAMLDLGTVASAR